ncbi:MAG: DUF2207 domain-containing protein [Chloroflexi bacterium]|nr:DUF2207 domain-containing protein [Chloroflexota bacterium]MDA1147278.1 DUF2207 domain-containing protein [Chloroflexota bacterium]
MTTPARSFAVALLLLAAAFLVAPTFAPPAEAQSSFEQILGYDVTWTILENSDVLVSEVIEYDFGSASRHGIFRDIPIRFDVGDTERVLRIHDLVVTASPGTPDAIDTSTDESFFHIRIGDPETTVSGVHTYRIDYRIEGSMNAFDDHDELYLNAIGPGWTIPISNMTVTATAPDAFSEVTCFAGYVEADRPCDGATFEGNTARFTQQSIGADEAVTPVLALPKGVVTVSEPIIEPAPSFASILDAQSNIERIRQYDVTWTIRDDGDVLVSELIEYDFADNPRRGIFRDIPVRFHYDDTNDRLLRIKNVAVSASPGAPDDVKLSTEGTAFRIRIGDPDITITGVHTYRIDYRIEGGMNAFDDHSELFLNAVGPGWEVKISDITVTVTAPAAFTEVTCYAGPVGSRSACDSASSEGSTARFAQQELGYGQAITPVVSLPLDAVAVRPPILEARRTFQRAFSITPFTIGAMALVFLGAIGTVIRLIWVHGRDQRFVGSVVDVAFGSDTGETQRVPLFESAADSAIEFAPPEGALPGQMGTLVDEVANPLDVTATIIDLAVRHYLTIEEVEGKGWFAKDDWRLKRLKEADPTLREYERELLDGLFEDGDDVLLADLKNKFVKRLKAVQDDLYRDVVAQGWFLRRPDQIRSSWVVTGIVTLIGGVVLTVLLAMFTTWALIGIPVALAGLLMTIGSNAMPRRSAKGTGMMRRVLGFQRAIATAERDTARWAEEAGVFSKYLPYAVVFGLTDRWAKAFEGLDAEITGVGSWYVSDRPFTTLAFASMVGDFSKSTAGTIVSTPSSSGSSGFGGGGFSGGGMGGGGGGSW